MPVLPRVRSSFFRFLFCFSCQPKLPRISSFAMLAYCSLPPVGDPSSALPGWEGGRFAAVPLFPPPFTTFLFFSLSPFRLLISGGSLCSKGIVDPLFLKNGTLIHAPVIPHQPLDFIAFVPAFESFFSTSLAASSGWSFFFCGFHVRSLWDCLKKSQVELSCFFGFRSLFPPTRFSSPPSLFLTPLFSGSCCGLSDTFEHLSV